MRATLLRATPALVALTLAISCSGPGATPETGAPKATAAAVTSTLVPNLRPVGPRLYSSGKPAGEEAFRALAALGIRTVISVDGERPDLEAARRAGLRYVHLPFNYSGIPAPRALEIVKAARDLPGPVLIHCHHGKQRSPAAAAIARLALDGATTTDEALSEMRAAGADPRYKGLYASVASFHPPREGELDAIACSFPEVAPAEPLVDAMVTLSLRLERLERGTCPEGDAKHEALLVSEGLTELARLPGEREARWHALLDSTLDAAAVLEAETRKGAASEGSLRRLQQACSRCHERYRD